MRSVFVEKLGDLDNHFERAMVTFLEYPQFWKGATLLLPCGHSCPMVAQAEGIAAPACIRA
jgi:hypothetical protein